MKRLGNLLVGSVTAMMFVLFNSASVVHAYSGYGSGTQSNPYRIASCAQLQTIQNDEAAYYTLVSNIDCSNTTVASIGNFTGTLDGQNHTISNITINGTGLFAEINGATIENLALSNGSISASGDSGSFVGWAIGGALSNLHSDLAVPGNSSSWVGGLVGLLDDGATLANSSYSGAISGGYDTGGLVGMVNNNNPSVTNSYFNGSLTANSTDAGGIAGELYSGSIADSYSAGTISMNGETVVGGLVGLVDAGSVGYSFAANTMTGSDSGNGAVFGTFDNPATRTDLYYDQYLADNLGANSLSCAGADQSSGNCTAENVSNASPSRFMNNIANAPLSNWNFTSIWAKTTGYPSLQVLSSFNAPAGIPNNGDANGDGAPDSYQANVADIKDTSNVWSTAEIPSSSSCTFGDTTSTSSSDVAADTGYANETSLDGFSIYCPTAGMTVPVTLIYTIKYDSANLFLRDYNPTTQQWSTVPGATFNSVTIGNVAETEVTYSITDGGSLDQDGLSNGIIVDPVALAIIPVAATNKLTDTGTNVSTINAIALFLIASASLVTVKPKRIFDVVRKPLSIKN